MTQRIEIVGLGPMEFPDSMSKDDIAHAIDTQIMPALASKMWRGDFPGETATTRVGPPIVSGATGAVSPEEAALAYSGSEPASPVGLREGYSTLIAPVTNAVGSTVGWLGEKTPVERFFDVLGMGRPALISPEASQTYGQEAAKVIVPQTPEQLAIMAATGGVGKVAAAASASGVPVLTRMGEWAVEHPSLAKTAATAPVTAFTNLVTGRPLTQDVVSNTAGVAGSEAGSRFLLGSVPKAITGPITKGTTAVKDLLLEKGVGGITSGVGSVLSGKYWPTLAWGSGVAAPYVINPVMNWASRAPGRVFNPLVQSVLNAQGARGATGLAGLLD